MLGQEVMHSNCYTFLNIVTCHVVTRSFLRISVYLLNTFYHENLKDWSGRERRSAGALDKMTRSAGALDKTEMERGAERGVGALERWSKIGRSAGALTKKGRSAGALIPLYGPQSHLDVSCVPSGSIENACNTTRQHTKLLLNSRKWSGFARNAIWRPRTQWAWFKW